MKGDWLKQNTLSKSIHKGVRLSIKRKTMIRPPSHETNYNCVAVTWGPLCQTKRRSIEQTIVVANCTTWRCSCCQMEEGCYREYQHFSGSVKGKKGGLLLLLSNCFVIF